MAQVNNGEGQPSPIFIPSGGYYTIPEVAALLGEDRRTVNNWLKSGRLQGVKTGIGWLVWADGVKEFTPPKPGPKPSA